MAGSTVDGWEKFPTRTALLFVVAAVSVTVILWTRQGWPCGIGVLALLSSIAGLAYLRAGEYRSDAPYFVERQTCVVDEFDEIECDPTDAEIAAECARMWDKTSVAWDRSATGPGGWQERGLVTCRDVG